MILFFAGCEKDKFRDILSDMSVKNILQSYYWLKGSNDEITRASKKFNIFLDSGGYTARKQGIDINVEEYGLFLDLHKDKLFTAANLDVMDLDMALANQRHLEQYYPVLPVYHFSEYKNGKQDLLEEFCKTHEYIAIGGMAGMNVERTALKNFLNSCFKVTIKYKTKVHGFGITASKYLMDYPFYSVDSTTWLSGGRYGQVVKWGEQTFKNETSIHYSNRNKFLEHNLDIELTGEYEPRLRHNVTELLKMERDITKLWAARGIKYD